MLSDELKYLKMLVSDAEAWKKQLGLHCVKSNWLDDLKWFLDAKSNEKEFIKFPEMRF